MEKKEEKNTLDCAVTFGTYNMTKDTTVLGEEARTRYDHVAVRFYHYIVVLGGRWHGIEALSLNVIWTYNIYTEQWSKLGISAGAMAPPPTYEACAAVIGLDIYIFGGNRIKTLSNWPTTNSLWKLSKTPNARFEWSKIEIINKAKSPSPRCLHSGWEYDGKLWTFGGRGLSPIGFLNDHGDYQDYDVLSKVNNQLLCFDPTCQEWMNPKCSGSVPPPLAGHASTIITDNVWQYGGLTSGFGVGFDYLYVLNILSRSWTRIEPGYDWPHAEPYCSFTALTNTYLVLHGLHDDGDDHTWILNLFHIVMEEV